MSRHTTTSRETRHLVDERVGTDRLKNALRLRNAGVVYTLVLLAGVFWMLNANRNQPNYLRGLNLANILDSASLVGIVVTFTTLVLISGNFDLSVGSVAAFGAIVTLSVGQHHSIYLAIFLAVGAGAFCGLVNGVLVQYVGINAFIVTLGTLTAISGLVLVISNGQSTSLTEPHSLKVLAKLQAGDWSVPSVIVIVGIVLLGLAALAWTKLDLRVRSSATVGLVVAGLALVVTGLLVPYELTLSKPSWYFLILTAVTWWVLNYTVVGRRLYAVGGNTEAARLMGINVNRYKIMAFVLSGTFAAFMGVLYGARLSSIQPTDLSSTNLTALAAAILGGTSLFGGSGSVIKSMFGTFILFVLQNGFDVVNIGPNYQSLIQGSVIILAAGSYVVAGRRGTRHSIATDTGPTPHESHEDTAQPPAAAGVGTQGTFERSPSSASAGI